MKPVFISRDGVINTRIQGGVTHRTKLTLIEGSVDAIVELSKNGFTVVMVTHQPGLSRGLFDLDELEAIHSQITDAVEQGGGEITATFYCPHDKEDHCYCCPPLTGLLDVVEIELDCHAEGAFYFCDNPEEMEMAKNKGCIAMLCDADNTLKVALTNAMNRVTN